MSVPRFANFSEAAEASETLLKSETIEAIRAREWAIEAAYELPSQPDHKHPGGQREAAFLAAHQVEHEALRAAERRHQDRRAAAAQHFLTPDAVVVCTGGRGDATAQHGRDFLYHGITRAGRKLVEKALRDWDAGAAPVQ